MISKNNIFSSVYEHDEISKKRRSIMYYKIISIISNLNLLTYNIISNLDDVYVGDITISMTDSEYPIIYAIESIDNNGNFIITNYRGIIKDHWSQLFDEEYIVSVIRPHQLTFRRRNDK